MFESLWCKIWKHDYNIIKYILTDNDVVKLVRCKRCSKRYIMSKKSKSFLRYDNDIFFMSNLKYLYNITKKDLIERI